MPGRWIDAELGVATNSLPTPDVAGLTLHTSKTTDGHAGVINLGVNVG